MRKLILLAFCSLRFFLSPAQTFENNTGGLIEEVGIYNYFPIEVSGLSSAIDTAYFGLLTVCIDVDHTYVGDLSVRLQSPDGNFIMLSNHNGDEGNKYNNTCFAEDGQKGPIQEGEPPYNGNYIPEQSINILNNLQDPNGTWFIVILDEVPLDTGTLEFAALTFGNDPPPTYTGGVCTGQLAGGCACPDGSNECDLLPDMTNSADYILQNWTEKDGFLKEGIATPNIGWGPLEMHGTYECYCDSQLTDCAVPCPDGSYPKEKVIQTIYHKKGDTMSTYTLPAGYMSYHPDHGHIHIDYWTDNTLRIRGADPDPRTWPIIGESEKTSFCLINLGTCTENNGYCLDDNGQALDLDLMPNGGLGEVTGCERDQGIYVGKYDAYDQYLPDQRIDFGDVCNGEYYIVSITDPNNIVKEINDENNVAAALIELVDQQGNCCNASFFADVTEGIVPFQVQFIDSTVPIAGTWQWDFGDGTTSTEQFPIHVYAQPGVYTVTCSITTSAGCTSSFTRQEYITAGTGTAVAAQDLPSFSLHCFPNPFAEVTSVDFRLESIAEVRLTLTDVAGNEIAELFSGLHPSGEFKYEVDGKKLALSQGLYFVRAKVYGKNFFSKLVKL